MQKWRRRVGSSCVFVAAMQIALALLSSLPARDSNGAGHMSRPSLLFYHVPKTAGHAIEEIARGSGYGWGRHQVWKRPFGPRSTYWQTCPLWHVPPHELSNPKQYEGSTIFCVTRNPFSRTLSDFKYLRWREGRLKKTPCTAASAEFWVLNATASMEQEHVDHFCHIHPQSWHIWDPGSGAQFCQEIIRYEALAEEFDYLMAAYGMNLTLNRVMNKSPGDCNLTLSELSTATLDTIRSVYAEDFRRLGYRSDVVPSR